MDRRVFRYHLEHGHFGIFQMIPLSVWFCLIHAVPLRVVLAEHPAGALHPADKPAAANAWMLSTGTIITEGGEPVIMKTGNADFNVLDFPVRNE